MNDAAVKQNISNAIQQFDKRDLTTAALELFNTLGYNTERQSPLDKPTSEAFKKSFINSDSKFNEEKALFEDWEYVDLLFQLSNEELNFDKTLFKKEVRTKLQVGKEDRTIMETYLFFAIELGKGQYSRTELSRITREVNRLFPMPVMILFKTGGSLTLSVINRRVDKRDDSKDVLKKVTLIKDIRIENPHRAHIEILFDLTFSELLAEHKFSNFVDLHKAWQKTLDTKELNNRFFRELSNWYFWAKNKKVSFPDDIENNEEIRNATNLIRLITRVIFIWFIKEKSLVPEAFFNKAELKKILKEFYTNKSSSSFYKAILQNLFFGTLNQKMDERYFAREDGYPHNVNEYGVKNLFRYADLFNLTEKEALALFKDIPFLNGGLFDCLDKPNDEGKILYVDGFSRNPKKQANVPDFLFFADEHQVDLNKDYGTKNKKHKVKGLIEILSSYKFTITENTPVEEEVALDPELLGRVFENLLASYNPETQTTARKQTGSFYTPREIVNYMVDESLKAYLKQELVENTGMKEEDAGVALNFLFEYNEKEHLFEKAQTEVLIQAIDTCKILDPACGSGAFPMGILHKLVHILDKIDPNNEQWKDRQIEKAKQIDDIDIRDKLIKDIEEAFACNELDYGRKLYLIENCIFGVDIQPIAVQIAKLRFFISLVVDQKKQVGKDNFGIRALPNLETKFVAANTLISLDKPDQMGLQNNPKIKVLEKELKDLRHEYFSAKTRQEKLSCQKKDKELRKRISKLLIQDGWDNKSAEQIAEFDPYNQNASATFFDPEWMFGLIEGLDIVIGNPPYLIIPKKDFLSIYKTFYKFQEGKPDLYRIFIENSLKLLSNKGITSFIIPNTFLTIPSSDKLRRHIIENYLFLKIVNYDQTVFESVSVNNIVYLLQKILPDGNSYFKAIDLVKNKTLDDSDGISINQFRSKTNAKYEINIFSDETQDDLIKKIVNLSTPLGKFENIYITLGLQPYHNTIHSEEQINSRFLHSKIKKNENYFIELGGKNVKKYSTTFRDDYFLDYSAELYTKPPFYFFERPRLIIREIVSDTIIAGYTDQILLFNKSCYIVKSENKNITNKYLLILLNSKLIGFIVRNTGDKSKQVLFPRITMRTLKSLPIIKSKYNKLFELVSNYLIYLKTITDLENRDQFYENLTDSMVYELYMPEIIQSACSEVIKHLTRLPELKDDWSEEKRLKTIESVYKELSDPKHPVSIAMNKMQEIEEIKIIEGKR